MIEDEEKVNNLAPSPVTDPDFGEIVRGDSRGEGGVTRGSRTHRFFRLGSPTDEHEHNTAERAMPTASIWRWH